MTNENPADSWPPHEQVPPKHVRNPQNIPRRHTGTGPHHRSPDERRGRCGLFALMMIATPAIITITLRKLLRHP